MRWLVVVVVGSLVACGGSADQGCPSQLADGDPCAFTDRCWHDESFSPCLSGWCTCEAGRTTCTALAPQEGDVCGDEPVTECTYEGNPSCDTNPTAEACSCTDDGLWHCDCFCYGGQTSCPTDPCALPPQRLEGARCADAGSSCTYPGAVTCTCEVPPGGGDATYACR